MLTDAQVERDKYELIWQQQAYRQNCHGLRLWYDYRHLFPKRPRSALDIGCGTGRLIKQWLREDIVAYGVDIAENAPDPDVKSNVTIGCLWEVQLGRYDIGCCADVMEHIPPHFVRDVLYNIHKACDVVVYNIASFESEYMGRTLHLTRQPMSWWNRLLSEYGDVNFEPGREGIEEGVFQVTTNDTVRRLD